MAKTLEEILRGGRVDPAALREMQEQAKKAGLTKRTIHIELDLLTGNMKWQATPMDNVMHLGMIEFYKASILAEIMKKPISKTEEPEAAAAPEVVPPAPTGDAPPATAAPGTGDSDPAAPAVAAEGGAPSA